MTIITATKQVIQKIGSAIFSKKSLFAFVGLLLLLIIGAGIFMEFFPPPNSESGYECCAIAIDASRAGGLLKTAAFLFGIAMASMIFHKIWKGIKGVHETEVQRALRWVCGFSEELLSTLSPPSNDQEAASKNPPFLRREFVAPVIKLLGEFLVAAQSGDGEKVDQIRNQLGVARSDLEKQGWKRERSYPHFTVYFLYKGEKEQPYPPIIGNWRATGRLFRSKEDAAFVCRHLSRRYDRIENLMIFDLMNREWIRVYHRKDFSKPEKKEESIGKKSASGKAISEGGTNGNPTS